MAGKTEQPGGWSPCVVIADAGYVDKVAFDLTVNFERMLGRRVPKADLPRWAECAAMDGGLRPGVGGALVVLVHAGESEGMENFAPGNYVEEISGKAFRGPLGEFELAAAPAPVSVSETMADIAAEAAAREEVERIVVAPDTADSEGLARIVRALKKADRSKDVTLLAMEPVAGCTLRQEILGYSLLQALGISGEELDKTLD